MRSFSIPRAVFAFVALVAALFAFNYSLSSSSCEDVSRMRKVLLGQDSSDVIGWQGHLNSRPSYKTDFPKDYFWKLDSESRKYDEMLQFLDVVSPRRALHSVSEAVLSNAVIVSAMDSTHYDDLTYMCRTMAAYKKFGSKFERRLIVYLLGGFDENELKAFSANCSFVEFRLFPFHLFPDNFKSLKEYRFKPIVVAFMLKEYNVVYWMDASARFDKRDEAASFEDYLELLKKKNIAFALSRNASHSVFAATHPTMYEYLPIEMERTVQVEGEANIMLFIGTKELKSTILLRYVQCALVSGCMAPPGHRLKCQFQKDRYRKYAGCHRYDQSAVNIIANLYTNNDMHRFIVPFRALTVRRHSP